MTSRIVHWIVLAIAVGISAFLIPGVTVTALGALLLAIVLGIINVFIRPVLSFLTLPINILTLGIFSLIINALLIMLAAAVVPGFAVSGFWSAFFFSIVLAIISALLGVSYTGD